MNDRSYDAKCTDVRDVIAVASTMANSVQQALDGKAVLIPEGYRLHNIERFQDKPRRVQERVQAHTLKGFLDYFEEYANATTAVFADPLSGDVQATFDYHEPAEEGAGRARWAGHHVTFEPQRSRQLEAWMKSDEREFEQMDFAHFIEEHTDDVIEPPSARMLEIVQDFQATRDVEFGQASHLESGDVQLTYKEETSAAGEMTVPEKIRLSLPVFKGGTEHELEARFMYRIQREGLRLKYRLLQIDDLLERAASHLLDDVEEKAGEMDVPVYYAQSW